MSASPTLPKTRAELAAHIDHTVLKAEAVAADIDKMCDEAREYRFAAVCVNSVWVPLCVKRLNGSGVAVATVAGFPLGANLSTIKADEATQTVEAGATEVDMVVNLGALRSGEKQIVADDIWAVVSATRRANPKALVKVILETAALTDEQVILGCRCAAEAQAEYVKTSTGFHAAGGATEHHVRLLHKHAAPIKVKASGGIRDLPTALAMLAAGATRLGMSAGVAVVRAMSA